MDITDIRTSYDPPPVPSRAFDWNAVVGDYDEGDPVGYGATEQEAIDDLIWQIEER
jgi:hypothetical protein